MSFASCARLGFQARPSAEHETLLLLPLVRHAVHVTFLLAAFWPLFIVSLIALIGLDPDYACVWYEMQQIVIVIRN